MPVYLKILRQNIQKALLAIVMAYAIAIRIVNKVGDTQVSRLEKQLFTPLLAHFGA